MPVTGDEHNGGWIRCLSLVMSTMEGGCPVSPDGSRLP